MTEIRKAQMFEKITEKVKEMKNGREQYNLLHNTFDMTNQEITECGFDLTGFYQYDSTGNRALRPLYKLETDIVKCVDYIVKTATTQTEDGGFHISYDTIYQNINLNLEFNPQILDTVTELLRNREEINKVYCTEYGIDMICNPVFCQKSNDTLHIGG